MPSHDEEIVLRQNTLIISLLGRIAFPKDTLKELVQRGSKKPREILLAYNSCDGNTSISEIAQKAGITQPSLSIAVDKWESQGIILKLGSRNEVRPQKLFEIE